MDRTRLKLSLLFTTAVSFAIFHGGLINSARFEITSYSSTTGGTSRLCSQEERKRLLADGCARFVKRTKSLHRTQYWRLLVDDQHKVMYCVIPKAGSTTIKALMANNSKYIDEYPRRSCHDYKYMSKLGLEPLSSFSEQGIRIRLKEYSKLLLVRHPLVRLYSAFVDKIQERHLSHPEYYHDVVRELYPWKPHHGQLDLNLTEFLTLISEKYVTGEFVNRHWESQYKLCHPCHISYDYVAKIETMDTDEKYVLSSLGIDSSQGMYMMNTHASTSASQGLAEVMASVPGGIVDKLTEIYGADFKLFGYNLLDENRCAIENNNNVLWWH